MSKRREKPAPEDAFSPDSFLRELANRNRLRLRLRRKRRQLEAPPGGGLSLAERIAVVRQDPSLSLSDLASSGKTTLRSTPDRLQELSDLVHEYQEATRAEQELGSNLLGDIHRTKSHFRRLKRRVQEPVDLSRPLSTMSRDLSTLTGSDVGRKTPKNSALSSRGNDCHHITSTSKAHGNACSVNQGNVVSSSCRKQEGDGEELKARQSTESSTSSQGAHGSTVELAVRTKEVEGQRNHRGKSLAERVNTGITAEEHAPLSNTNASNGSCRDTNGTPVANPSTSREHIAGVRVDGDSSRVETQDGNAQQENTSRNPRVKDERNDSVMNNSKSSSPSRNANGMSATTGRDEHAVERRAAESAELIENAQLRSHTRYDESNEKSAKFLNEDRSTPASTAPSNGTKPLGGVSHKSMEEAAPTDVSTSQNPQGSSTAGSQVDQRNAQACNPKTAKDFAQRREEDGFPQPDVEHMDASSKKSDQGSGQTHSQSNYQLKNTSQHNATAKVPQNAPNRQQCSPNLTFEHSGDENVKSTGTVPLENGEKDSMSLDRNYEDESRNQFSGVSCVSPGNDKSPQRKNDSSPSPRKTRGYSSDKFSSNGRMMTEGEVSSPMRKRYSHLEDECIENKSVGSLANIPEEEDTTEVISAKQRHPRKSYGRSGDSPVGNDDKQSTSNSSPKKHSSSQKDHSSWPSPSHRPRRQPRKPDSFSYVHSWLKTQASTKSELPAVASASATPGKAPKENKRVPARGQSRWRSLAPVGRVVQLPLDTPPRRDSQRTFRFLGLLGGRAYTLPVISERPLPPGRVDVIDLSPALREKKPFVSSATDFSLPAERRSPSRVDTPLVSASPGSSSDTACAESSGRPEHTALGFGGETDAAAAPADAAFIAASVAESSSLLPEELPEVQRQETVSTVLPSEGATESKQDDICRPETKMNSETEKDSHPELSASEHSHAALSGLTSAPPENNRMPGESAEQLTEEQAMEVASRRCPSAKATANHSFTGKDSPLSPRHGVHTLTDAINKTSPSRHSVLSSGSRTFQQGRDLESGTLTPRKSRSRNAGHDESTQSPRAAVPPSPSRPSDLVGDSPARSGTSNHCVMSQADVSHQDEIKKDYRGEEELPPTKSNRLLTRRSTTPPGRSQTGEGDGGGASVPSGGQVSSSPPQGGGEGLKFPPIALPAPSPGCSPSRRPAGGEREDLKLPALPCSPKSLTTPYLRSKSMDQIPSNVEACPTLANQESRIRDLYDNLNFFRFLRRGSGDVRVLAEVGSRCKLDLLLHWGPEWEELSLQRPPSLPPSPSPAPSSRSPSSPASWLPSTPSSVKARRWRPRSIFPWGRVLSPTAGMTPEARGVPEGSPTPQVQSEALPQGRLVWEVVRSRPSRLLRCSHPRAPRPPRAVFVYPQPPAIVSPLAARAIRLEARHFLRVRTVRSQVLPPIVVAPAKKTRRQVALCELSRKLRFPHM